MSCQWIRAQKWKRDLCCDEVSCYAAGNMKKLGSKLKNFRIIVGDRTVQWFLQIVKFYQIVRIKERNIEVWIKRFLSTFRIRKVYYKL